MGKDELEYTAEQPVAREKEKYLDSYIENVPLKHLQFSRCVLYNLISLRHRILCTLLIKK